jgi:hypothetical protein
MAFDPILVKIAFETLVFIGAFVTIGANWWPHNHHQVTVGKGQQSASMPVRFTVGKQ